MCHLKPHTFRLIAENTLAYYNRPIFHDFWLTLRFFSINSGPLSCKNWSDLEQAKVSPNDCAVLLEPLIWCQRPTYFLCDLQAMIDLSQQFIRKANRSFSPFQNLTEVISLAHRMLGTSTAIWPVCGLLLPLVRWMVINNPFPFFLPKYHVFLLNLVHNLALIRPLLLKLHTWDFFAVSSRIAVFICLKSTFRAVLPRSG